MGRRIGRSGSGASWAELQRDCSRPWTRLRAKNRGPAKTPSLETVFRKFAGRQAVGSAITPCCWTNTRWGWKAVLFRAGAHHHLNGERRGASGFSGRRARPAPKWMGGAQAAVGDIDYNP